MRPASPGRGAAAALGKGNSHRGEGVRRETGRPLPGAGKSQRARRRPDALPRVQGELAAEPMSANAQIRQISWPPVAEALKIVVLQGDQTGQELLEQALRILDAEVLGLALEIVQFDLSLENRRETDNRIVYEAATAMREAGYGLKAATVTPEGKDDVGSPNRILREQVGGTVSVRTARRIPGITPVAGVHFPISIVRMAVGDAYGAEQWREGQAGADEEVALRTERITRSVCRGVAEYAFRSAAAGAARVYGGPKWTVSPVYEGMLKEEMDAAAERHPDVDYRPVLIDATYAGLIGGAADVPLVIPALNRDGDCLSDLVMPMFGSIAGAESICSPSTPTTTPPWPWPRPPTEPRPLSRARTSPTRWP